jgi:hypothetical protein
MQDTASSVFQMDFFNAFPVSFMQFYQIYAYPGPNYDVSSKHIEAFRNLTQISPASYCKRLITLAIGGRWDADAVSYLKSLIHDYTKKNPKMLLSGLSEYSRGYQLRFWQFYWSSLAATHEYQSKYNKLRAILYPISPEQIRIMDIAFEFAWKEMDTPDVVF